MNRCTRWLDEILHEHVPRQPLKLNWISRSCRGQRSRSHGFFVRFFRPWHCGYPRTVLSLEQGLTIFFRLIRSYLAVETRTLLIWSSCRSISAARRWSHSPLFAGGRHRRRRWRFSARFDTRRTDAFPSPTRRRRFLPSSTDGCRQPSWDPRRLADRRQRSMKPRRSTTDLSSRPTTTPAQQVVPDTQPWKWPIKVK